MNRILVISLIAVLLSACGGSRKQDAGEADEEAAKAQLQGIWLDDDTDTPFMQVRGDSIYYTDSQAAPVYFRICKDTLYIHGNELASYRIDRQSASAFWFRTVEDNVVKLYKSEDMEDTLAFPDKSVEAVPVYTEVVKKDSVVMYEGTRYRAYVYINPSKIKVVRTTYSDEGLNIDKVYYDNVMHICVYEGKKCLYSSDITRQMFAGVISEEILNQTILSDMDFIKVDSAGFHYLATVGIPGSSVSNRAKVIVGFDWKLTIAAVK